MPDRSFSLSIKGDLSLPVLASALADFSNLVVAISQDAAPESDVSWFVDDLEAGSLDIAALAKSSDSRALDRIDAEYLSVGRSIQTANGHLYSESVSEAKDSLAELISDSAEAMRFETPTGRVTIGDSSHWPDEAPDLPPTESKGSVEGTVRSVTSRGGLRFTIYDSLNDSAVRCHLTKGEEEVMREVWQRRAVVDGLVKRDGANGRPLSIRNITSASVVKEPAAGSYRSARGVVPRLPHMARSENVIRRLRDAD